MQMAIYVLHVPVHHVLHVYVYRIELLHDVHMYMYMYIPVGYYILVARRITRTGMTFMDPLV